MDVIWDVVTRWGLRNVKARRPGGRWTAAEVRRLAAAHGCRGNVKYAAWEEGANGLVQVWWPVREVVPSALVTGAPEGRLALWRLERGVLMRDAVQAVGLLVFEATGQWPEQVWAWRMPKNAPPVVRFEGGEAVFGTAGWVPRRCVAAPLPGAPIPGPSPRGGRGE